MSGSGMGRDVHSLMLFIKHFPYRPRRPPTLQGVPTDGFGEAVAARLGILTTSGLALLFHPPPGHSQAPLRSEILLLAPRPPYQQKNDNIKSDSKQPQRERAGS